MDQVISFDKSLQQRLQEYENVLTGYEVLPVSAIQKEWGFYLELTLDPNGWQAVWKIQRKTCEVLNIPFPTIVLVFVLSVNLQDLTALVKVLAVQDDIIHIQEKHHVPLIHLWPTKEQDKSIALNLQSTANVLDMLRFFYIYLFMPWDYEDDDSVDWPSKHLETRLRLYYDMKNGVIPRATGEHLNAIISEAKRLQTKREEIEAELEGFDDDAVNMENTKVQTLMELHIRLMEIKSEVEILENPLLRGAIINKQKQAMAIEGGTSQSIWVIYEQGTANNCIQFLANVEKLHPNQILKFSPKLSSTLESANSHDIYILSEGIHAINTTGALEHGGVLKGVSAIREKTILISSKESVMLDCKGENILIENLTINAISAQCAIIVRSGRLTLKNCKLIGDGKTSTHQGIIVLNGGALDIADCEICNFYTAIVGNTGSCINIVNSEIFDCNFGLKIFDDVIVKANKATIRNCKDYGICLETENHDMDEAEPRVGTFDTLNIIPKLKIELIRGNDNKKGDAIINHKSKLQPVVDLFENADSDPTICINSDDEMDVNQSTVIESGRISPATV